MHSRYINLNLLEGLSLAQIDAHIPPGDLRQSRCHRVAQIDQIGVVQDGRTRVIHIGSGHLPLVFGLKHELAPGFAPGLRGCGRRFAILGDT